MRSVFDDFTEEFMIFICFLSLFFGICLYMYISAIAEKTVFNQREIIIQHAHITAAYCREIDATRNSPYMFTEKFSANTRKITA